MIVSLLILLSHVCVARPQPCTVECRDADVTHELRAALAAPRCARVLLSGPGVCESEPLTVARPVRLELRARLRAARKWTSGAAFLTVAADDFQLVGDLNGAKRGVLDGNGHLWWTGSNKTPGRPPLLVVNGSRVLVKQVQLLNAATFHLTLIGSQHVVRHITIHSPDYLVAPNTDGIDMLVDGGHVHDVFVRNGDDSICIKKHSRNILVENSVVEQGNGLVVGTGDFDAVAGPRNITFRNCRARHTLYGAHVKFKKTQRGVLDGVVFENIDVHEAISAAMEICQYGQNCVETVARPQSTVQIRNVVFKNITGKAVAVAGRFFCRPGTCHNVHFEDIDLSALGGGCFFRNVDNITTSGTIEPKSCRFP